MLTVFLTCTRIPFCESTYIYTVYINLINRNNKNKVLLVIKAADGIELKTLEMNLHWIMTIY